MSIARIFRLAAMALAMAAIIGSLTPSLAPPSEHHLDKLLHLAGYGALGAAIYLAQNTRWAILWAFLLACALGGGLELTQSMVPGREASLMDALTNATGAALGVTVALAGRKLFLFR